MGFFFNNIFDSYTEDDWGIIDKVEYGSCCLRESPFVSIEGIQKQIDSIECPTALVYYVLVENGEVYIKHRALEVELYHE